MFQTSLNIYWWWYDAD